MLIWLIALLFVLMAAATGFYRGALRAAVSLVGLVVALFLAAPLGDFFQPILRFLGLQHPFVLPFVAPWVVFLLISAAAKGVAAALNAKVENHFRYSESHLGQVAFERLSSRVGAAVGAVNGMIYTIAFLTPFYVASHATLQLPDSDTGSVPVRIANAVGRGARETGFDKVLAGFGAAPKGYYSGADLLASVLNSPGIYLRIHLYPDLTKLAESPEITQISSDAEASALFAKKSSLGELMSNPRVVAMVSKIDFAKQITGKLTGDTTDLAQYLRTGTSPLFSEESVIGVWVHSPDDSLNEVRRKNSTLTTKEMARIRSVISAYFPSAEVTMFGGGKARLSTSDGSPNPKINEAVWTKEGSTYLFRILNGTTAMGVPKFLDYPTLISGDVLYVSKDDTTFIFKRRL